MPNKVSWGRRLTPKEIQDRDARFRENCAALKAEVEKRLEGINARITITAIRTICEDCPVKPYECHLCQVDASMSKSFEEASLVVNVKQKEG
ncbi:MAG: hypothetical protein KKF27_21095 [Gammaproteobacteria bacterium]|nr:hypothetical protein [Gammaproteobacteria bacterium]MBU2685745.1 hypothetical protein [Gammaproteobacteria bacterium]